MTAKVARKMKAPSLTALWVAWSVIRPPSDASPAEKTVWSDLFPPRTRALTQQLLWHCPPVSRISKILMFVLFYLVKILNYLFKSRYGSRANLDPLHMPIRKRIVYDEVVQAIKGGVRQVVVFGAGLDILPLYLAREHPQVTFLEIDHPNSQLMKRAAIEKIYATLHDKFPANHVFVDVDFRSQTVAERISNKLPTWNSSAKTVGVAEGLWMYLTEAEIRASLQDFRKLGGPGSLMIFNYYTSFTQSSFGTLFRYLLAAIGEPLKYQPGTREEIARLVSSEGFKVDMEQKRCDGYERYIAGTSKAKVISKGGDLNFFGFATNE